MGQSNQSGSEVGLSQKEVFDQEKTVISQRPAASPREFYQQMPLAELADLLEGKMLDHFAVGQLIGGGGMGAVFRGLDKRLDRVVAIKVIPVAKRDEGMLRRFRLEAQAAARLDHPNIARVFYVGEAQQWDYIVFEFIDGINVRDLVEMEGSLSVDDAVFYTRQIAEALQHAHERDVVHRDIKPSNILVTASGTAKLVDMGLARDTSPDRSSQDRTASGITLGTFDYISPEQARNPRDADVRSDLYSLGCSLFYMLTGHPPFPEGTALQKLLNHGSLPPPDPRGWRDDVPDELYQILMKLMAKRPIDRYQKPIELVNDLLVLAELGDLPRSQAPTTLAIAPTMAQPTFLESHLPWLVAVAFLLGSTLWLQSQSISSGFALPPVSFPGMEASSVVAPSSSLMGDDLPTVGPTLSGPPSIANDSKVGGTPGFPIPSFSIDPNTDASSVLPMQPLAIAAEPTESQTSFLPGAKPDPLVGRSPRASRDTVPGGSLSAPSVLDRLPNQQEELGATATIANEGESSSFSVESTRPLTTEQTNENRIIVSSIPPADSTAEYWESSLFRAVQRWASQPGEVIIEVRGKVWLDRPLEIDGTRRQGSSEKSLELVIRGAQGTEAKIEIARGVWNNLSSDAGVILLRNANLVFRDVHVQAVLNETPMVARSIVQMEGNSSLEAQGCTFTIESDRPGLAHLLTLGSPEQTNSTLSSSNGRVDSRRISFDQCFVRGGTSVLKLLPASLNDTGSIQISLNDSVVAVEGRVLNGHSATGPSGIGKIVRMFCQWSTFVCTDGFAKLEFAGTSLPLAGLSRTAQSCVFWSRPNVAHVTIVGESFGFSDHPDLLFLQGQNNAYDRQIERVGTMQSGANRTIQFEFTQAQQDGWYVERGNDRAVAWKNPPQSTATFQNALSSDFLLTPTHFVPGIRSSTIAALEDVH